MAADDELTLVVTGGGQTLHRAVLRSGVAINTSGLGKSVEIKTKEIVEDFLNLLE